MTTMISQPSIDARSILDETVACLIPGINLSDIKILEAPGDRVERQG